MKHFLDLGNCVVVNNNTTIKKAGSKNVGINWVPSNATTRSVDTDCCDVCDGLIFRVVLLNIDTLICAGYRYKTLSIPVKLENCCVPFLHHLYRFQDSVAVQVNQLKCSSWSADDNKVFVGISRFALWWNHSAPSNCLDYGFFAFLASILKHTFHLHSFEIPFSQSSIKSSASH